MVGSIGTESLSQQQELILQYFKQLNNPEEMSKSVLKASDKDGDEMLNLTESGLGEDVFIKSDADGDGLLTQTEIAAGLEAKIQDHISKITNANKQALASTSANFDPSQISAQIVSRRDKDGDGLVSESESRMKGKKFSMADSDNDGFLSADEIAGYIDKMVQTEKDRMGYKEKEEDAVEEEDALTSLLAALDADKAKRADEDEDSNSAQKQGDDIYNTLDILA